MKTKSDDIKLLAEAYGKIYAEQPYSNLPPEEEVENLNSIPRNKDRYDILEMPVE